MLSSPAVAQDEGNADGSVDIYVDAPSEDQGGTKIGTVMISSDAIASSENTETGSDGTSWTWISTDMETEVSGIHGVYFVFGSSETDEVICKLDQFRFEK